MFALNWVDDPYEYLAHYIKGQGQRSSLFSDVGDGEH